MVDNYYSSVTEMKRVGKSALDADLKDTCHVSIGNFLSPFPHHSMLGLYCVHVTTEDITPTNIDLGNGESIGLTTAKSVHIFFLRRLYSSYIQTIQNQNMMYCKAL